jgi:serine/threonine-protein kinase
MLTPPPSAGGTRRFAAAVAGAAGAGAHRRATRLLAPLAALLAGAGIAVAGTQLLGSPAPAATAAPATETGPSSFVLASDDYVGRPVGEVEAELGGLGLSVERVPQETAAQGPGTVTAVSPAGSVRKGDRVTVSYAVAPAPAVAPVPEAPPAPAPAPTLSEAAVVAPARGDDGWDGGDEDDDEPWNGNGWGGDD